MTIRPYIPTDEPALRAMHEAQGFGYPFPSIDPAHFAEVLVYCDENGVPVQAVLARKTVEVFYLTSATWRTPAWRLKGLFTLHLAMHDALLALGFTDAHAWLPPRVVKAFGKRLQKGFGWVPETWQGFCKYL